jgi:hypothetical protein
MIPRNPTSHYLERGPGMHFMRRRTCEYTSDGVTCGVEFDTSSARYCPACRKLVKAARKCRQCGKQATTAGLCGSCYRAKKRKETGR